MKRLCAVSRVANIALGAFYALVMAMAVQGAWYFYKLFGAVEIALTLGIAWQAWQWPRPRDAAAAG